MKFEWGTSLQRLLQHGDQHLSNKKVQHFSKNLNNSRIIGHPELLKPCGQQALSTHVLPNNYVRSVKTLLLDSSYYGATDLKIRLNLYTNAFNMG